SRAKARQFRRDYVHPNWLRHPQPNSVDCRFSYCLQLLPKCDAQCGRGVIAVVAASRARASGSEYPDCAACAAAEAERAIEAHALKLSAATTDFIMLTSLADGFDWCPRAMEERPTFCMRIPHNFAHFGVSLNPCGALLAVS